MIIDITDPNDASVRGALSNRDPIDINDFLAGGFINLFIDEHTSSSDPKELFNLQPPPSFNDAFMVWGELDENGAVALFLAPTTGDRTFPFATLDGFKAAMNGSGATAGSGTLTRSNTLPPDVNWQVSP
jgi:hypothetical protein